MSVAVPTLFLLLFIFSLFPPSLSRTLTQSSHTTAIFDVSLSTKSARNAVSFNPQTSSFTQPINTPSNSSVFSLPLHPRQALEKSPAVRDYNSLVQSRLARDAARVRFLNQNLELALHGEKKKFAGKSRPSELRPDGVTAPITSGLSQGSGEYFARFAVGQPTKSFFFVPDTGSDVIWLQCLPCESCYQQTDPIFDPSSSSSFTSLSCDSQQCEALDTPGCSQDGVCQYQVSYGDGSFTVGDFAAETLTFPNSGSISGVGIGCGHDNEGLFVGSAGIVGLGGGPLSFPSQIKASSFSYCLVDQNSDSSSTLEFNSAQLSGSVTAPLITNQKFATFRYVDVAGMSVGGQPLPIPATRFQIDESGSGGVIVDSGTIITRLETDIYEVLRDAFSKLTQNLPPAPGVSLFDTCYDLSSQTRVMVPTVSFEFAGGKSLQLPANNCLVQIDSAGTFCFAFAPTSTPLSIVGSFQQQKMRVGYDFGNSVVGFLSDQC